LNKLKFVTAFIGADELDRQVYAITSTIAEITYITKKMHEEVA